MTVKDSETAQSSWKSDAIDFTVKQQLTWCNYSQLHRFGVSPLCVIGGSVRYYALSE